VRGAGAAGLWRNWLAEWVRGWVAGWIHREVSMLASLGSLMRDGYD
jgi:hypothetical protein